MNIINLYSFKNKINDQQTSFQELTAFTESVAKNQKRFAKW